MKSKIRPLVGALLSSGLMLCATGCDTPKDPAPPRPGNSEPKQARSVPSESQQTQATPKVSAISACKLLSGSLLKEVYPSKSFVIETDRNDEPNIYEALSTCRYREDGADVWDTYYVDLEVRARATPEDARRIVQDANDTDYEKQVVVITGLGDAAYLSKLPMTSGGPYLEIARGNVYAKVKVHTMKKGAFDSIDGDLRQIAHKIVQKLAEASAPTK